MGDDYSVRVIAGGAVEEYCFSGEDYCRCPGECWYRRHVVLDIDDPVRPDDGSRIVSDCHRDIVQASTWESVDGWVAVPPLDVAFRVTGYPAAGLDGLTVKAAVGGWTATAKMGLVIIPGPNSSPTV